MKYQKLNRTDMTRLLSTASPHSFAFNISKMHSIYRLPNPTEPSLVDLCEPIATRLRKFKATLLDEILELEADETGEPTMMARAELYDANPDELSEEFRQDLLTDLADWFADLTVYCRSEAMKFGIPLESVQDAVMGSNFTKLPSDGIPIYDENGKFLKDKTNFVPPERAIKTMLFGLRDST